MSRKLMSVAAAVAAFAITAGLAPGLCRAQCTGAWSQVTATVPSPRIGAGMAYNPARGAIVLFGGNIPGGTTYSNTTWQQQDTGSGPGWVQIGSVGPAARGSVQLVTDSLRGRVVLFGGSNATSKFGDTWVLLGGAWAQYALPAPLPPSRDQHALAYDSLRDRVVLFGGSDGTNVRLNDTWEFDSETWVRVAQAGPSPSPRQGAAMAFDENRAVCVLFGGSLAGNVSAGDTWEWDGTMWSIRSAGGTANDPTTRSTAGLAYEGERQRVVLFGGTTLSGATTTVRGDTWEWDGAAATWRRLATTGPSARDVVRMAYDPNQRGIVLYGGRVNDTATGGREDTHIFRYAFPTITTEPQDVMACPGAMATFSVVASGGGPFTYQWRRDTEPLMNGPTAAGTVVSGATAAILTLSNIAAADLGLFDCLVTDPCGSVTSASASMMLSACVADVDCNGTVAIGDLFGYLALWFAGSPRADLNGIDGVSVQDLFDYLALYFAGCG